MDTQTSREAAKVIETQIDEVENAIMMFLT